MRDPESILKNIKESYKLYYKTAFHLNSKYEKVQKKQLELFNEENNSHYKMQTYPEALLHYFSKINESYMYYIEENELLLIPSEYSFPDDIEKALIIRSGFLPKINSYDGSLNYSNLRSDKLKGYQNISKDDLMVLERAIYQKAKILSSN